jgi:hypothetical protein
LAISPCLLAQTVTVTPVVNNGTSGNIWRAGTNRVQAFYDASTFTSQGVNGPIVITALQWYVGNGATSVSVNYPSVDVFLDDAKVDYASPSLTFADNRSDPASAANFSGSVTTTAQAPSTPGLPLCSVTLTNPFVYVPQSGQDLIIDLVINTAPTPLTGTTLMTSFSLGHFANSVRAVGNPTALLGTASAFAPIVEITYHTTISNVAQSLTVGQGCYNRPHSFFESWADPNRSATVGLDIDPNTSGGTINGFDLLNLGDNYLVVQNNAMGLHVVPGSGPTTITLNNTAPAATDSGATNPADDCYWTQTLPFSFVYPGNAPGTTQIHISSNGTIWLQSAPPAGSLYAFDQAAAANFGGFVSRPAIAPNWMDLEPADGVTFLGGLGNVIVDTDGLTYYSITWDGCREWLDPAYPGGPPTILSTCQLVLENSGTARVRYGAGGCNHHDCSRLVGFSYGDGVEAGSGPSPRQQPDLSAATVAPGYVSGDGARNAFLYSTYRPKVGKPIELKTTNFDVQSVFNIHVISTSPLPGLDLGILNMPGCNAYVLLPEVASDFQAVATTVTWPVLASIPLAFAGATVYAQSVQLLSGLPLPRNAANIVVSNAVYLTFEIN